MSSDLTAQIAELNERVLDRILQLGFADLHSAHRISRHLAEIAVLGRAFADVTLPLFLAVNPDHLDAVATLAMSIKCDLEEMSDSLVDVAPDLRALADLLNGVDSGER